MTVTEALLERAIRERREAIEERDRLREAAQAVVDVADLWADDADNPLWDDIPVELTGPLDTLRAALEPKP